MQRPRVSFVRGHVYTPRQTKEAQERIQWAIKASYRRLVPDGESAFCVRVIFYCATKQRKDLDNMCKIVFDACNKFIWEDDQQVQELHARVFRKSKPARTQLCVYRIGKHENITMKCECCRKEFEGRSYPSLKRRFCSKKCAWDFTKTRKEHSCVSCGKIFPVPTARSRWRGILG